MTIQPLEVLTETQQQVLKRVVAGASRKQIALERKVSDKTIEFHCMETMKRLNLWSIAELVHWALVVGLIEPLYSKEMIKKVEEKPNPVVSEPGKWRTRKRPNNPDAKYAALGDASL